jgi:ligand-binding sensor protein
MQTTFVRQSPASGLGLSDTRPAAVGVKASGSVPTKETPFKPRTNGGNGNGTKGLIEALANSKVYQEYERAFTEATGLPVALRPVESWQLPHHGRRNESPFCDLLAQKSRACAACLQVQERLSDAAVNEPHTVSCPVGMCDTAIPVRLGDRLVGFLQTGQVFRKKPTQAQFERAVKLVGEWGLDFDLATLKSAYFSTRVVLPRQHEAVVKLLAIFSQHLSMLSNQVVVQQENAEPPVIRRVCAAS